MVSVRLSALAVLGAMLSAIHTSLASPALGHSGGGYKRSSTSTSGKGEMFQSFVPPPKLAGRMFDNFVPPPTVAQGNHSIAKRDVPGPPHWVIYQDAWESGEQGPPAPSVIQGFNVFIMAFLFPSGGQDQAAEWQQITADQRASIKAAYNAAGIKLLVSAFGSTSYPTSLDPVATANSMAAWVIQYGVDGIDVDYEDFDAMNRQDGTAENWLIAYTKALRAKLPQGQYILTHAPVAPWFSKEHYASGAYWTVNNQVGNLIDWYNVQFYNQGVSEYTTCSNLFTASSSQWPNTAVFQLANVQGVALNKIVVGKPAASAGDANNGYIDPSTFASCLASAKAQGWSGGAMFWQYPHGAAALAQTVRSLSWPVGSSPPPTSTITTTTKTSSTPTNTPTGGSGGCSGVAAWSSGIAYTGGQKVTYGGHLWTAKWWTQADTPGGAAGVWTDGGSC